MATFTADCYLETVALGTRSEGQEAARAANVGYFTAFPDFAPEDEGFAAGDDFLVSWGSKFSSCSSFDIEVLAADVAGDLGYVVAIERTTASVDENEPAPYALRVSTVFRREEGEWNVVHRHGDPYDESAGSMAAQLRASAGE